LVVVGQAAKSCGTRSVPTTFGPGLCKKSRRSGHWCVGFGCSCWPLATSHQPLPKAPPRRCARHRLGGNFFTQTRFLAWARVLSEHGLSCRTEEIFRLGPRGFVERRLSLSLGRLSPNAEFSRGAPAGSPLSHRSSLAPSAPERGDKSASGRLVDLDAWAGDMKCRRTRGWPKPGQGFDIGGAAEHGPAPRETPP
jgi:hypothetical protein